MILDYIQNAERYINLQPRFAEAFQYIRENISEDSENGVYDFAEGVTCRISHKKGKTKDEVKLKFHKQVIDIHYLIKGNELIGWKAKNGFTLIQLGYDAEKDFGLCADKPKLWLQLSPGMFAIFFPEDGHAPMVSDDYVQKAVIKVRL